MTIGQLIWDERVFQGFSLEELASESGVEAGVLASIESGDHYPTAHEIDVLCFALRRPLAWSYGQVLPAIEVCRAIEVDPGCASLVGYVVDDDGHASKMDCGVEVASEVASRREVCGFSLQDLSDITNIPLPALRAIENGDMFPTARQIVVCHAAFVGEGWEG